MREGVDGLAQHDAPEAVDIVAEQPAQQALVAKQIDQGDGRQHRRCQQWQQRNPPPQALGRDQRALQGKGEQIGQRYHNGRDSEGHRQAVAKQPMEAGAGEQFTGRQQATALARFTAETTPEDRQQRHQHGQHQQDQQQALAADDEQPVAQGDASTRRGLGLAQRQGHWRGHLRQTPAGSAAATPPRCPANPGAAWPRGPVRPAGHGLAGP
ncbi:hypothetical protein D3C80_1070340 [compost metagenome]